MPRFEVIKTGLHASQPWQVFALVAGSQPIPCGSFKTKRAAMADVAERAA